MSSLCAECVRFVGETPTTGACKVKAQVADTARAHGLVSYDPEIAGRWPSSFWPFGIRSCRLREPSDRSVFGDAQ